MYYNETVLTQPMIRQFHSYRNGKDSFMIFQAAAFFILLLNLKIEFLPIGLPMTILMLSLIMLTLVFRVFLIPASQVRFSENSHYQYAFFENNFRVDRMRDGTTTTVYYNYQAITGVYAQNMCIYIELNQKQFLIVDKHGFPEQVQDEIIPFLHMKRLQACANECTALKKGSNPAHRHN